jgi:hypothetical protein
VTLVADTDYRFIYNSAGTAYTQLERRVAGVRVAGMMGSTDEAAPSK